MMSERLKHTLRRSGSAAHVREFGNCVGVVIGLTDYGTRRGPEFDVRWQPSSLRYAYAAEDLELLDEAGGARRHREAAERSEGR